MRRYYYRKKIHKKGQGLLEYILITSLVGIICLVAMKDLGTILKRRTEEVKTRVTTHLKLGD